MAGMRQLHLLFWMFPAFVKWLRDQRSNYPSKQQRNMGGQRVEGRPEFEQLVIQMSKRSRNLNIECRLYLHASNPDIFMAPLLDDWGRILKMSNSSY